MIQLSPFVTTIDYGRGLAEVFAELILASGEIALVKPPRMAPRRGGSTPTQKFIDKFAWAMSRGDTATESATPGASGAEAEAMKEIVAASPYNLYTVSCLLVKNYKKKYPDDCFADAPSEHAQSAMIIAATARDNPAALHLWTGNEKDNIIPHKHKSVRPWDQRLYRGPECDRWMSFLPEFGQLPKELQAALGDGSGSYSRSMAMPFGMVLGDEIPYSEKLAREKGWGPRQHFEKIIELYGHRHGSFYSRKVIEAMQSIAKLQTGKAHIGDVTAEELKPAQQTVRRQLRMLFHLARNMQTWRQGITEPAKGIYPLAS